MTGTRFSIITITDNDPDGFEKTMCSVKAQTCRDFEWIVVHGGSDSRTIDLIRENSKDITWHCTGKDTGLYNAMNIGTDQACGDYLIYMNGGDKFANADTLKLVGNTAKENNNPDFIYGDTLMDKDSKLKYFKASGIRNYKKAIPAIHQSIYFKREKLGDLRYDEKYRISADYDICVKFVKNIESFSYIEKPLSIFNRDGISSQNILNLFKEATLIRHKTVGVSPAVNAYFLARNVASNILMRVAPDIQNKVRNKMMNF